MSQIELEHEPSIDQEISAPMHAASENELLGVLKAKIRDVLKYEIDHGGIAEIVIANETTGQTYVHRLSPIEADKVEEGLWSSGAYSFEETLIAKLHQTLREKGFITGKKELDLIVSVR